MQRELAKREGGLEVCLDQQISALALHRLQLFEQRTARKAALDRVDPAVMFPDLQNGRELIAGRSGGKLGDQLPISAQLVGIATCVENPDNALVVQGVYAGLTAVAE
jgi:hypothetical protein